MDTRFVNNKTLVSFLVLAITMLGCSGGGSSSSMQTEEAAKLLDGDWYVYSVLDEDPNVTVSHHYWTFTVDGDKFDMYEACSSGSHSTGTIYGDTLFFDGGSETAKIEDNKLYVEEKQDGAPVGRTFIGQPVQPLACEDSGNGTQQVATQSMRPREGTVVEVVAEGTSTDDTDLEKSETTTETATCDNTTDLCTYLQQSAGTLLPTGTEKDPTATGKSSTTSTVSNETTTSCTSTPMTEAQIMSTFSLFDTAANIYPGAIIQGAPYMNDNTFVGVTLGRAPITILLDGPTFSPNASLSQTISDPGKMEQVAQGIKTILDQGVLKGVEDVSSEATQAYSEEQINLDLKVAGNLGGFSGSASFKYDSDTTTNYMVFTFTQRFYSVKVNPFGGALNAFAAGVDASPDPITGETQIGADNPPLYVRQVDYGKQLLLTVSTEESLQDIKATLEAAYKAGDNGISGGADLSTKSKLNNSTISYKVRGGVNTEGSWIEATYDENGGVRAYDFLTTFFKAFNSEEYTEATPAVPIGYTLDYLVNDKPAGMLYASDYTERNCSQTDGPYSWYATLKKVDDHAEISLESSPGNWVITNYNSPGGDEGWYNISLDDKVSNTGDSTLAFVLKNNGGWATGMTFILYRGSTKVYQNVIDGGTGAWTGKVFSVHFSLNKKKGSCKKTYYYTPGVNAGNISYAETFYEDDNNDTYCTKADDE